MNLRLRLIVVFFLLSVVPLGALTLFTYVTNARAVRDAAGHEAELLAGELTQRMQLVTTQLTERVELIADLTSLDQQQATAAASAESVAEAKVAAAMGQVAMLLNSVEIRNPIRGAGAAAEVEAEAATAGNRPLQIGRRPVTFQPCRPRQVHRLRCQVDRLPLQTIVCADAFRTVRGVLAPGRQQVPVRAGMELGRRR